MTDEFTDFPIDFKSDIESPQDRYYVEVEDSLRALAKGHTDITGAMARLARPAEGRSTTPLYEANITVYSRPQHINATEKADDPMKAIQNALRAVERQVREKRARLRGH